MKRLFSLIAVFFLIISVQSCKQQESAVEYNNNIILHQQEIVYKIDNLKKSIDKYNILPEDEAIELMNMAYDSLIFQIDTGMNYINSIEGFKDDVSLKEATSTLFSTYKDIIEGDYKQIIELYKMPANLFEVSDQQKLDSLLEISNKKLDDALKTFIEVHTKFATENKLVIE